MTFLMQRKQLESIMITIQIQDINKNWVSVQFNVMNQPQVIMTRMQETQRSYPGKRVRAIDDAGRLVDLLE